MRRLAYDIWFVQHVIVFLSTTSGLTFMSNLGSLSIKKKTEDAYPTASHWNAIYILFVDILLELGKKYRSVNNGTIQMQKIRVHSLNVQKGKKYNLLPVNISRLHRWVCHLSIFAGMYFWGFKKWLTYYNYKNLIRVYGFSCGVLSNAIIAK